MMDLEFNTPPPMFLPCGGTAYFNEGSGYAHRCECGAVVGSIGMPKLCREEKEKYENWVKLGGRGWDYSKGQPKK